MTIAAAIEIKKKARPRRSSPANAVDFPFASSHRRPRPQTNHPLILRSRTIPKRRPSQPRSVRRDAAGSAGARTRSRVNPIEVPRHPTLRHSNRGRATRPTRRPRSTLRTSIGTRSASRNGVDFASNSSDRIARRKRPQKGTDSLVPFGSRHLAALASFDPLASLLLPPHGANRR